MTEPATPAKRDPEQVKTLFLYGVFVFALILQLMPSLTLQMLSLLIFAFAVVIIYILKHGAVQDGLLHNHATYLARTFWIWSFLMTAGTMIASFLIYQQHDMQAWMGIAQDLLEHETDSTYYKSMAIYFVAGMAPGLLYLTYRLVKGMHRALNGYRLAKPKSWI
jgi:uncharacterized membrane protein